MEWEGIRQGKEGKGCTQRSSGWDATGLQSWEFRELAFILKVMYALYIHMSVYMYGFTRLPFISIDTYLYNHLYTLIYAFIYTYQLNR